MLEKDISSNLSYKRRIKMEIFKENKGTMKKPDLKLPILSRVYLKPNKAKKFSKIKLLRLK
jgi:hypothetical protein